MIKNLCTGKKPFKLSPTPKTCIAPRTRPMIAGENIWPSKNIQPREAVLTHMLLKGILTFVFIMFSNLKNSKLHKFYCFLNQLQTSSCVCHYKKSRGAFYKYNWKDEIWDQISTNMFRKKTVYWQESSATIHITILWLGFKIMQHTAVLQVRWLNYWPVFFAFTEAMCGKLCWNTGTIKKTDNRLQHYRTPVRGWNVIQNGPHAQNVCISTLNVSFRALIKVSAKPFSYFYFYYCS